MRKIILAGNWKMNLGIADSITLAKKLKKIPASNKEIVICPSFTALQAVNKIIKGSALRLGAQNICIEEKGAYTGEISGAMLKEAGCSYCIVGHSERRHIFHETDDLINRRVKQAIASHLIAILCVGETQGQREQGKTSTVIVGQINSGLKGVAASQMNHIVIAYEPVWAIGTGKTATPMQAQEAHETIRKQIGMLYGGKIAESIRIIYGGSVNPGNIADIMLEGDIDGVLVGGASLNASDFLKIVHY